MNDNVEIIVGGGITFGYLYKSQIPSVTTFLTPNDCQQQAGFVVYPKDSEIPRHYHADLSRAIINTTEVLFIISGSCIVDFYDEENKIVCDRLLQAGNVLVIVKGGHGFRVKENLVIFEVKQGPYLGTFEKIRF